jgi:hypothetical protein
MTDETTAPEHTPSPLQHILIGKQGIRAGWSISIFIVLTAMITALLLLPTKYMLDKNNLPLDNVNPLQIFAIEVVAFLGVMGASMLMARIEHNLLISYGLEGPRRLKHFVVGAACGIAALSVLVVALIFSGYLSFDGQNIFGWEAVRYGFGWGAVFLMVGLYEEYFLRGYMLATLTRGIGFWWGAVLLSIAFGCIHLLNTGESPIGIGAAALVGIVFCISLWYLKTLWWAIGFHASWDWAESFFWGTADSGRVMNGHLFSVHPQGNVLWSGGATGPEGSLLVIPVLLIVALLLWIVVKKKDEQRTA